MKKIMLLVGLMLMLVMSSACSRVESGHVGVKVYMLGGDKG